MKTLNLAVLWLYDPKASKLLTGGMERWCRDVARLARKHDYQVTIWQKSILPFRIQIEDEITIQGIKSSMGFRGNRTLSKALIDRNLNHEPFVFVSQEILGFGNFPRAVAVNHGIWWDGDFPFWKRILNKRLQKKLILSAQATICVDTNYINWCHAELSERYLWEQRLFYVPNYADTNQFKPQEELSQIDKTFPKILFPRRVNGKNIERDSRGVGLLIKAIEILESDGFYPQLIFAGRGRLQNEIQSWADKRGSSNRVRIVEVPFDKMPELYAEADVVVVPTLEHEGTSLSAVEGMLAGKRLVVTHIGGLCNIVVDQLNGYVADLSPKSLANSIREAVTSQLPPLSNKPLLEICRNSLGKSRWEKKIWSHLQETIGL